MKTTIIISTLTFICLTVHGQILDLQKGPVQDLFNGKNLVGWYQITDETGSDKNLFKVEAGTIHAYPTQIENSSQSFGAIITENDYEDYVLSLEYKWGEKKFKPRDNAVRDAGVIIHVSGENVIWPSGIECQIQEGDTGDLWIIKSRASSKVDPMHKNFNENGLLSTLGTQAIEYNRFPRSFCWEKPGWNKVVLVVRGDYAQFYINDKLVNEAIDMKKWNETQKKWIALTRGKILLQAEGSEIFYRNISIQSLKKD